MRPRWWIFLSAAVLIGMVISISLFPKKMSTPAGNYDSAQVHIAGQTLVVTIPLTAATQAQGLAGRRSLDDAAGMMWRYHEPTTPTFWMKGMIMPIDIIWIKQGKVVDISAHLPPPTSGQTDVPLFQPSTSITEVLEVAAGFVDRHRVKIGDSVTITPD